MEPLLIWLVPEGKGATPGKLLLPFLEVSSTGVYTLLVASCAMLDASLTTLTPGPGASVLSSWANVATDSNKRHLNLLFLFCHSTDGLQVLLEVQM